MHTAQNYKLSKTNQLYKCGKHNNIAIQLTILKRKNWLEEVRIIWAEYTKIVCRTFTFFWRRIL